MDILETYGNSINNYAVSYSDKYGNTRLLANETAIKAAFTLDYSPQKGEPFDEAETLSASSLSGASSVTQNSGSGNITGGGLRKLSDYKTVYFDPVKEKARIDAIRAAQNEALAGTNKLQLQNVSAEPLTVIDWGPRGNYSSAIQRPSVYVIFSQPMVPLSSLGEQESSSALVAIQPSIKGSFRWYGTSFLSFEGDEPCKSQQIYTITVSANAKSIYGTGITGERNFNFVTEILSIKDFTPGEEFRKKSNIYFDGSNVPPEAAKNISLTFNYPVVSSDISQYLSITAGNAEKKFNLKQENEYKLIAEIPDKIDFETEIRIILKKGAKSGGGSRGTESDQSYYFKTPSVFKVDGNRRITAYGKYGNLVEINFSHALNESSVRNAVSVEPAMKISEDNIEVRGNNLRIFNLPVKFGDKFKISVSDNVEDIYGRKLKAPYSCEITMPNEPPPTGSAEFPDYRSNVMLESQYGSRYLFEYHNIISGYYRLAKVNNPWSTNWNNADMIGLSVGTPNTKYFEEISLPPYLNNQGKGFINFNASINVLTNERINDNSYRTGSYVINRNHSIQVTDLGMTVRYGFNKAVVLVTSLSTGKAVEGAKVKMYSQSDVKGGNDLSDINHFYESITDKNGLAVINMNPSVLRNATVNNNHWRGFDNPFILAEKDGDMAIFEPSTHNIWSFGVYSNVPQKAEEIIPVTFMFSDRGLYMPGETLTFRGVDRSKVLGIYAVYQGGYSVILEENAYRPKQAAVLSGTTTESGGFYGKINIPDDLTTGSYRLVYKRDDGTDDDIITSIPITVAFFERLKFQASLSSPAAAVIMGDDININLQASYLSGGSLSGASWESSWYEELAYFQPKTAEAKKYVYGPRRAWDSKRYIASASGVLSGQGTAGLSQKTGGSKVTGAPYIYQAAASVTDISNQMISATRSVLVHPAAFYIGLNKGTGGFIRAGQELICEYLMVNNDGEIINNAPNALFLQSSSGITEGYEPGQMKVELIREEWRRIQQKGVSGYIYDEYTRQLVTDSEQKIVIRGNGSIKVKPSSAGYHILRVSAKDREGRTALTEIGFYVTGSGGYWNMNNPSEIMLTADQEMYEPGDTAKILLQSSLPQGNYLITVEREGIFSEEVRYFNEPVTVIDIPIARNYVPVVYAAVSSYSVRTGPPVHEYGNPDLDKPEGYFGIVQLNINPRVKAFTVKVESNKKTYRPGEEVTMTLTAVRDGKPLSNAELTLMAVDRGILDLINYHVPDPIEYFYSQYNFPLSVYGGDSRQWLMDPITYNVKNLSGGDADGESKIEERRDFSPTAVFEPFLVTDAAGKVTCTFKLPDNLTTYRVTVFGVRGDLFALKESEIAAQNKINVREVVPRRMRERDTAEAGVLITNLDSSPHTLNIKLEIGSPLQAVNTSGFTKKPGQAFVDGVAERRVTVKSGENAVVYFDIAAVKEGNITLNFTVNSEPQKNESTDAFRERLIREMIIEHPYIMETVTTTGIIDNNRKIEGLVIPSFADNGIGSLSIALDATRLSLLDTAITWLFRYPYGCLEQRSSAIMPLVVFGEYLDALNIKSEVSNPQQVVENELKSWAQIQLSGGGFPYWPSGTRADFYVSLRIAHIIAIAKAKKINVPSSFNTAALITYLNREYQEIQKVNKNSGTYYYQSYLQSYMLYVMALLGERVDASRIAEIVSRDNIDVSVLAFAGMTYRELKRNPEAFDIAMRLRNLMRMTVRGVDITDPLNKNRSNFYGNNIEQMALCLQFFAEQFPEDQVNSRLLFSLLENYRSGYWQSTADTVRVLSAIDALIKAENLVNLDVSGIVSLAGKQILDGTFKGLGAKPVTEIFNFSGPVISTLPRDKIQNLEFARNGKNNLYYTASLSYAIPSELQSFRDEGIGVFISIFDIKTGEEIKGASQIMNLQSGKTYRAKIRVSSTRDRTFLALRVPIPSGGEILDAAFVTTASYSEYDEEENENDEIQYGSWISHQSIYDNEIHYFWDQFYKGESNVSFLFRTARRGVYPTPPVHAESMYEPEIFGRSKGIIYTIE